MTFFVVVFSVAVRRQCCSYFAHCECTVELSTKKNERRINLLLQDAEGKALFENLRVLRRVSFILNKNNNNQRITLGCVFNLISVDIDSRLQRAFLWRCVWQRQTRWILQQLQQRTNVRSRKIFVSVRTVLIYLSLFSSIAARRGHRGAAAKAQTADSARRLGKKSFHFL